MKAFVTAGMHRHGEAVTAADSGGDYPGPNLSFAAGPAGGYNLPWRDGRLVPQG